MVEKMMRILLGFVLVGCVGGFPDEVLGQEPSTNEGEVLYNGIVLPQQWPPQLDSNSNDPLPVPYLKKPPKIIPIDLGRQLFVDDFLVAKTDMKRIFHKPNVHGNSPVLVPLKKEGNLAGALSGGVFWNPEKKRFEMFYISGRFQKRTLNLATSQDMVTWKRPDVGRGMGNCIFRPGEWVPGDKNAGTRGATSEVFFDHAATDQSQRYKMLLQRSWGGKHTHTLRTSPDLVDWSEGIPAGPGHDTTLFFYNPFRGKWIFHPKKGIKRNDTPMRARAYVESDSFSKGGDWSKQVFWAGADRLDLPEPADGYAAHPKKGGPAQLYCMHVAPYESLMVGLFEIHRGPHNKICKEGRFPKLTDLNVGFSRDGFHWARPDRTGFINSTREKGSWYQGYTRGSASVCVVLGDQLIFPFTGFSGVDPFSKKKGMYEGATVGIATLRRDGFASMHAPEKQTRTLTTRPVQFTGRHLFVNVDAPKGALRVEVLDANGKTIPGFSMEDCQPLSTNQVKTMVTWKNQTSLESLAGKPVRFRFSLQHGDLYAFWVSKTKEGHSAGYLAGGGPGFQSNRDQ